MEDYEFCCEYCDTEVVFSGDQWSAMGYCPTCQTDVEVCPMEIWEDWNNEAAIDAARDARFE